MATHRQGDGFSTSAARVYSTFALGLAVLVLVLALLSIVGVPDHIIGSLLLGLSLCCYAVIGFISRTMKIDNFYVAGRRVPAKYNGMAAAAGAISATALFGIPAAVYLYGQDGLAFGLGITGGIVLSGLLIVPYLRRAGSFTVPDFLAARFGSNLVRLIATLVLVACSFILLVAQLNIAGLLLGRFMGISHVTGVVAALLCILLYLIPGGMRALTWTQVAQYILMLAAFLAPILWMADAITESGIPLGAQGEALLNIGLLESALGITPSHAAPFSAPGFDRLNTALLVLCLMAGTASLPHLLIRHATTRTTHRTRNSVSWALVCVVILLIAAPVYAAFAKWTILELAASGLTPDNISERAAWLLNWARIDPSLVQICGSVPIDAATVAATCWSEGIEQIGLNDIRLDPDLVVLALPEISGMPYVGSALLGAGLLAAALGAGAGLLLSIANTLSFDIHDRMIAPVATASRRLFVARVLLVIVGVAAAWASFARPSDFLSMVISTFSLAAAGLFPALVLSVWWQRANWQGVAAGMIAGVAVALYYMAGTRFDPVAFAELWSFASNATPEQISRLAELKAVWASASGDAKLDAWTPLEAHALSMANWFGVAPLSAAAFGTPLAFFVMIAVSLMTRRTADEQVNFITAVRGPHDNQLR